MIFSLSTCSHVTAAGGSSCETTGLFADDVLEEVEVLTSSGAFNVTISVLDFFPGDRSFSAEKRLKLRLIAAPRRTLRACPWPGRGKFTGRPMAAACSSYLNNIKRGRKITKKPRLARKRNEMGLRKA